MLQRGRKQTALAMVTTLPGQRAEPPDSLTREQRKVWRAVVATKPQEWFSSDSHPLLSNYCRHVCTATLLSERIDGLRVPAMDDQDALVQLDRLLKMRAAETKAALGLATALRLTPHSRLKAETAATQHNNNGSAGKPWDAAV